MSLWKIAWRSIQQRSLASALTALSMGLGVALVVAVLVIHSVVDKSFRRGSEGCNLIVGGKGGKLELVLNSVFYIGDPLPNVPLSYFEEFESGRFAPIVEVAIPICMGHNFKGCPVVATTPDFFEDLTYLDDQPYEIPEPGSNFDYDDHHGAVIGWEAARKTDLKIGDTFRPVAQNPDGSVIHEDEPFTVRGILDHTGTPNDGAIFINIEGFFLCPAHQQVDSSAKQFLQEKDPKGPKADETNAPNKTDENDEKEDAEGKPAEEKDADEGHDHDPNAKHDHADHDHDADDHDADAHADDDAVDEKPTSDDSAAGEDAPEDAAKSGDEKGAEGEGGSAGSEGDEKEDPTKGDAQKKDADHPATEKAGDSAHDHAECTHEDHAAGDCPHGHSHAREISAILIRTKVDKPQLEMNLASVINEEPVAQAVRPAVEISQFINKIVGNVQLMLLVIAVLVVIVAGIGIMVSIYNSMSDRKHEIAIMRALGARRTVVMVVILMESILLSLGGGVLGVLLGHGLVGALSPTIYEQLKIMVSPFEFQVVELVLVPGLIILATAVGYLPAVVAYQTDVAKSLTATQ